MVGLLSELSIKNFTFRNRIVLPPMQVDLATEDGLVTKAQIEHYLKYAPWCGLIIVEHTAISPEGRYSEKQLGIWNDKQAEKLKVLASSIHRAEGIVVLQLNHAGGKAKKEIIGTKPKAPSIVDFYSHEVEELTLDDINNIIDAFVKAAERAIAVGFDGVEIHGAHGFLLCQFWSPLTNKRKDIFGGNLENRMRIILEITRKVRKKLPNDSLLLYRLGVTDMMEGGITLKESKILSKKLAEVGVDILDISGCLCGSRPPVLEKKQGYWIDYAYEIKLDIDIPILSGGGITDPKVADKFIKEKKIDLIYVGRAQLYDSDWAKKAIKILKQ
ncbi:MAG: NADH:flavin oxidoreductase [Candidatus Njordarchaeales archaeon]